MFSRIDTNVIISVDINGDINIDINVYIDITIDTGSDIDILNTTVDNWLRTNLKEIWGAISASYTVCVCASVSEVEVFAMLIIGGKCGGQKIKKIKTVIFSDKTKAEMQPRLSVFSQNSITIYMYLMYQALWCFVLLVYDCANVLVWVR